MSEQAIETEEDFIIHDETTGDPAEAEIVDEGEEVIEGEAEETEESEEEPELAAEAETEEEDGEVEIVLEGEEQPTSKPRGVRRLINRVNAAKAETEESRRAEEALREENKLLRMQLEQKAPKEPAEDDFETDAEFRSALKEYYRQEAKTVAAEEASRVLAETQQQNTQTQRNQNRNIELEEHYKRADASGIKGYDELEGAAIDVMGQEFVEEIAANTDNAHIVIAHLGVNRGKAEKFAQMVSQGQPVKALLEIGALSTQLQVKRKSSRAASPETRIKKGIPKSTVHEGMRFE